MASSGGTATRPREGSWTGRPALGWALRILAVALPVLGSATITWVVANNWTPPLDTPARIVWWCGLVVVATASLLCIDRFARRLLPLATLLQMSLIFPDAAPSRFAVALRTGTTKQLERKLKRAEQTGDPDLDVTQADAAQAMLELVASLSHHDRFTRGHGERVRAYTALIGEELGLDELELSKLQWAGLIHDVGKLAVPEEILNKPGRLTDEEFEIIKTHPAAGDRMIEPLREWLGEWADAVVQHHERIDGLGYPAGLRGDEISLGAKIVSVADTFDVITAARSYKKPQSAETAKQELTRCAGTQFDAKVVRAFLSVSIGRLRLAMGPLSLLANLPYIGALTAPAASTATAVVVGTTAAIGGGVILAEPFNQSPDELALMEPATESNAARSTTEPPAVSVTLSDTGARATTSAPERFPTSAPTTLDVGSTNTGSTTTTTSTSTSASGANSPSDVGSTTAPAPTTAATSQPTTIAPGTKDCSQISSGRTDFEDADLTDCDLSGATLNGLVLTGADLSNASLVNTIITNSDLSDATLSGADLTGLTMTDGSINGADLRNTVGHNAAFTNIDVNNVDASNADFTGASFNNSGLYSSTLTGATFDRASFVNSDLSSVVAPNASFDDADLTGAAMLDADFAGASFDDAKLTYGDLARSDFSSATFVNALVDSASVDAATLSNADFSGADMWAAWGAPIGSATAIWSNTKCPNGIVGSVNCFP